MFFIIAFKYSKDVIAKEVCGEIRIIVRGMNVGEEVL